MPWQDQMQVEVIVEIEDEPTEAQLVAARYDAARLTDDPRIVQVEHTPKGDRHMVTTRFSMRFQAQYKVVDDIAHRFKMGIGCEPGYLDLTIWFPKDEPARRRKRS